MKLKKSFQMALNMVLHSRLRSWLTIIGIVIGVASVIAIVGIGEGMNQQIMSDLGDLDADIVTITPGYSKAQSFGPGRNHDNPDSSSSSTQDPLTKKDVQALKKVIEVDLINTIISGNVDLEYLGESGSISITGVDPKVYEKMSSTDMLSGRNLASSDSNVIIIGNKLATEYFEKEIKVNQLLSIEGKSFRVVGILDDTSRSVFMPIGEAFDVLDKTDGEFDSIQVRLSTTENLNVTEDKIVDELMKSRHVDVEDRDFTVSSNSSVNDMREELISTLTTFLTAIASVSLLVGAVGIANTMFTSVLEKTKDIGVMKSIGARNEDILIIFLFNAALIGLVGGLIGVLIGYGLAALMTMLGMFSIITINTVLMTLGISVLVGMISGFIPAINASKLNPVDALRRD